MNTLILNKKLELIQWLSTIEDEVVIDKIVEIQKKDSEDWYSLISDEEKKSILKGIDDADKGNLVDHSEARKIFKKWL